MTHFYIYYRIAPDFADEAKLAIRELQAHLAKDSGIQGRLLFKHDDPTLWMEIYEQVTDAQAFEKSLTTALNLLQIEKWLKQGSVRQMEQFLDS